MELDFSIVFSIIGVLAATGLAYFIGAGYRHRSYINQLQKQGFVSFLPFLLLWCIHPSELCKCYFSSLTSTLTFNYHSLC